MKKKEPTGPIKKLILHFDINKTLLIFDSEKKNLDKDTQFNRLMASYAWGKLEQKDENSPWVWKLVHNHFIAQPPEENCISYKDYILHHHEPSKKLTEEQEPNEQVRNKYNAEQEAVKNELINNMIKPGNPCIKLKPEYERINKGISLPKLVDLECKDIINKFRADADKTQQREQNIYDDKKTMYELFEGGKYHILPQFYKMMMSLKKQKKEFAIVFRTFGSDLPNVITEFNKFVTGEHPCYCGRNNTPIVRFDGTKGTKNFVINQEHTGLFYRNGNDIEETTLITGTFQRKQQLPEQSLEELYEKEIEEESVQINKGAQQIHVQIQELLQERCVLALQDDYQNWHKHNKISDKSKLLIVDPSDYYTQHIFFDDNITDDHESCADVREVLNGNIITQKDALGKYTVKVDLIDVLKEPDFFMKQIDACEKIRQQEIENIEKGINQEFEQEQSIKKSDFEILQEQTDSEYLKKTVIPLLHPALKLVDIERPVDPISFIALYCLKNQHRVRIPQPPEGFFDKKEPEEDQENLQENDEQDKEQE
ncbi:hypothetical protein PPERSA_09447 [Pseudocohnilembus persalinus]|uniref:Dpy-30 motif protein n=1 Tax=Pseudocohnilembus persalinus TaxID=266149 RepID=A0A0V0Q9T7_PSEPJ|nr:hypothetical protein PPERSA_09447 [Pseudocohnilembus persalinus]|eukprot:KRW98922.1 hypothetical protein PPERSA_09447 [Pseudocohnilembus persalinus]